MKISFAFKLGFLMILLTSIMAGSILSYFYQYSLNTLRVDLKQTIGDVTHTSAFVFNEEDRAKVSQLKETLYLNLPEDFNSTVERFSRLEEGETKTLLSTDVSNQLQDSMDFQYIVQLLRRIQRGSRDKDEGLKIFQQSNFTDKDASRVSWAYLLVPVPGVATKDALMFLADSNYEKDNISEEGNPIGNLYKASDFFLPPFRGNMGIAEDWYTDEFGTVMTAVVPLKDDKGEVIAALGVDYDVASFHERIEQQEMASWTAMGMAIVISIAITIIVTFWVSVPLSKLRAGAEQLSKHDFKHKVSIKSNDEFGLLAKTFNQVSVTLGKFTSDLEDIVEKRTAQLTSANEKVIKLNKLLSQENAHLGAEVDSLISLRENALPERNKSISYKDYQIEFYYKPSRSVCGDYWQIIDNSEEKFEFVFGKVSGYGLETASLTMQVQSLFATLNGSAEEKFNIINKYLVNRKSELGNQLFTKALNISVNEDGIVCFGQFEDPIIFGNERVESINIGKDNLPLGIEPSIKVSRIKERIDGKEKILIFSTGFKQAICRLANKEIRNDRPKELIDYSQISKTSAKDVMKLIESQEWVGELQDDISFVILTKRVS